MLVARQLGRTLHSEVHNLMIYLAVTVIVALT
jgi:hypothetical protein